MTEPRIDAWLENVRQGNAPKAQKAVEAVLEFLADGEMHEFAEIEQMIFDKKIPVRRNTLLGVVHGLAYEAQIHERRVRDGEYIDKRWFWLADGPEGTWVSG
jgi:hypothetical protein